MPPVACHVCKKNVTRTNNGSTCATCLNTIHFKCTGLTGKAVIDILNGTSSQWFCTSCDKAKSKSKSKTNSNARSSTSNIQPSVESSVVPIDNFINDQVNKISSAISVLQQEIKNIQQGQSNFVQSFSVIHEKISSLQDISVALNNHSARIKTLEEDKILLEANVKDLSNRLDIIDQNNLANSLEITGIPISENENIPDLVLKVSEKLNNTLSREDILRCHRKRFNSTKYSPAARIPSIILSFKDIDKRNKLLSAFRARRGIKLSEIGFNNDNYFFINESLTNSRKKLFFAAKTFQRSNNFKYLWTRNGKIFLKKDDNCGIINIDLNTDFTTINGA